MFKHYTIDYENCFFEIKENLKKIIVLARKEKNIYFSLLELRITDTSTYFNNEAEYNNDLRTSNLKHFNSLVVPFAVPKEIISESKIHDIRLFKKEFEKRLENSLN